MNGGAVRVEVIGDVGDLNRAVRGRGGTVVASADGLVLADVPASVMGALNDDPAVTQVRLPLDYSVTPGSAIAPESLADPAPLISDPPVVATASADAEEQATGSKGGEVLVKTHVDAWHAAGLTGAGLKIGIIDYFSGTAWAAAAATGDLPASPAGGFCLDRGIGCGSSTFWSGGVHGVAVAEIIRDMAPGAQIYLASVNSLTDYRAAVDYFAAQGVRIITRSLAAPYDGPGNGVGDLDNQVVDYAVGKGMAWFNSAGNSAGASSGKGGYFRTSWSDPDGDGFLNFPDGSEYQSFYCNPQGLLMLGLRWSDWGANRTDYDLYVYDTTATGEAPYASFRNDQVAGARPVEGAGFAPPSCGPNDYDYYAIQLDPRTNGTTGGDILEMMMNLSFLGNSNNPYSATQPASDSANTGTASVGAVDPLSGTTIATYSSWGPTNDGRMKPDMSAASGISSVSYPNGFTGTSAATPVLAGAAAVVLAHEPALTPGQLVNRMKSYVSDRGVAGPDNVYGTGELTMPALPSVTPLPPTPVPTPAGGAGGAARVTAVQFRPVMRKLSKRVPVEVSWSVATPQGSAVVARSVDGGRFDPVALVPGARTSTRTNLQLQRTNQLAVAYVDETGASSPFVTLPRVVPTVYDDRHRKMRYGRGWHPSSDARAWGRTLTVTNAGASRARLAFRGMAVSLVFARSGNSGAVRVYVDGRSMGRVSLRSRRVEYQRVVMNLFAEGKGSHVVEVQPLRRGSRGWVYLDGLVVFR